MQLFNVPNKNKLNQGFTTAEIIVTLIIAGILAAMATPNLLAAYTRSRVNEAVDQIQGALLEAQTQAIRSGRNGCAITISATGITYTGVTPPAGEVACLLNSRTFPPEATINSSQTLPHTVNFSYKGTIVVADAFTMWITNSQFLTEDNQPPCLVLSSPLGIVRTGYYQGGNCNSLD
jgi:prepilin-type N-terminal cleavage/methylation domain-containing protein